MILASLSTYHFRVHQHLWVAQRLRHFVLLGSMGANNQSGREALIQLGLAIILRIYFGLSNDKHALHVLLHLLLLLPLLVMGQGLSFNTAASTMRRNSLLHMLSEGLGPVFHDSCDDWEMLRLRSLTNVSFRPNYVIRIFWGHEGVWHSGRSRVTLTFSLLFLDMKRTLCLGVWCHMRVLLLEHLRFLLARFDRRLILHSSLQTRLLWDEVCIQFLACLDLAL